MNISMSQNFENGYRGRETGYGKNEFFENGKIFKTNSPLGQNNASMLDFTFPVNSGDEITFEIFARQIKGSPRIAIDFFDENDTVTHYGFLWREIKGRELKKYKLQTTVPYSNNIKSARIVLGAWGEIVADSEGDYTLPRLSVNSNNSSLQLLSSGLLMINNGEVQIDNRFKNVGFVSASYDDSRKEITVNIENGTHSSQRPLVFVSSTTDSKEVAVGGRWESENNRFFIRFTNGDEFISLDTGLFFVFFEVKG